MDDFFGGMGGAGQDGFDLAALQYFEALDRQAGKDPLPAPRLEDLSPAPGEEDAPMVDLSDGGLDSLTLQLMNEMEDVKPRAAHRSAPSSGRLTRPVLKKRAGTGTAAEEKPALSELAEKAARLFDTLPTEDQLLAYTLLQKLARAAER